MSKKLKAVEINNFRVYQDRQIFDFRYGNREVANLVLIYGPNGFGKTSFCDAIEWGLTEEIKRITKNSLLGKTVEYEKGYILKNRKSLAEYGEVILEAENGDKIIRKTRKLNRKTKKDYPNGEESFQGKLFNIENKKEKFSKCILSHDQIDSFLKAVTPEDRYRELIGFWDGEKDSILYQKLLNICRISKNEIENQNECIKKIKNEINEIKIINNGVLGLNKCIDKLNKNDDESNLKNIKEGFENFEIDSLKNIVILNKTKLNEQKQKQEKVKDELEELKINYENNIKKNSEYEKKRDNYKKIIKELRIFQNIKEINLRLENISQKTIAIKEEIINLKILDDNWYLYKEIELEKVKLEKNIMVLEKEKIETEIKKNDNRIEIDRVEELINKSKKYIKDNNEKLYKVDELDKKNEKILRDNKRIKRIERIISIRNNKISDCEIEKEKLSEHLECLDRDLEIFKINTKYSEEYEKLKSYGEKIKKIEQEIEMSKSKYNDLIKLENELKSMIYLGKEYIEKTKECVCPLCNTDHKEYANLISKINDKVKGKIEIEKLDEKMKKLEILKYEYIDLKEKLKTKICEEIKVDLKKNNEKKDRYFKRNIQAKKNLKLKKDENTQNNNEIRILSNIFSEIELRSINEKKNINGLKIEFKNDILGELKNVDNLTNKIVIKKELEKKIRERQNELEKEIKLVNFNIKETNVKSIVKKYKKISGQYRVDLNKEIIIARIKLLEEKNKSYLEEMKEKNIIKKNCEESIKGLIENELKKLEIEILDEMDELGKQIEKYIKVANKYFDKNEFNMDILQKYLNDAKEKERIIDEKMLINLEILNHIDNLTNNVILNKKQLQEAKLKNKLEILKVKNDELESLREASMNFIKNKIDNAIDVEGINNIYSKIEPHPSLKRIEFKPVYEKGKNPKLNIYATGETGENVEPTIYLSTAQLNILSLSIFLAKALNEKELPLNSIFMDDPVEHLDSINTLSFIDLMRNIITMLDIQIIITTHDEKLFNLFKMKINPEYYKVKYLRIDAYGSIANEKND